jgi:hypothetical protein
VGVLLKSALEQTPELLVKGFILEPDLGVRESSGCNFKVSDII